MLARARQSLNYRDLLYNLVVRDLKVRYKHSVLGFLWSLLNPLLLMAVFTFVFSALLPGDKARPAFHIFFLCALLPWNWCATSVAGALTSIVGNGHLIKKIYFPREMLPLSVVLSNMINYLLALPALLIFMVIIRPEVAGAPIPSADWRAEYFSKSAQAAPTAFPGTTLEGAPILVRTVPSPDINWVAVPLGMGLGEGDWLVQFSNDLLLEGGSYEIGLAADSGVRLSVDNQLKIDAWSAPAPVSQNRRIELAGGTHTVLIQYLSHAPGAQMQFRLARLSTAPLFGPGCPFVCLNQHIVWVPLLILTQALFLIGLGFIFSAMNVFFRDTSVLVEVGLSAWFFLTPIIYDAKAVAGEFANWMYYLNPMASIVANYRDIFYYNEAGSPDPAFMLRTLITCTIIFVAGYLFFMRLSRNFGEEV